MARAFLILVIAACVSSPAVAQSWREQNTRLNKGAITLKTGEVRLVDDTQTIAGSDRVFSRSSSDVFAIEAEGLLAGEEDESFSIGGEFLRYKNRFRRASTPVGTFEDTMYTLSFMVKSKYYFRPGKAWQPYVGAGIGKVWVEDFSGPINSGDGLGYQAIVGMQLRSDRFGVRVEYMALRGRLKDGDTVKVDASSRAVFAGISFFFGRR